jgi:hypothetical protein
MFVGHFAVGLGAKAAAPRVSLGTLFLAAQWIDLLWPTLLLLGVERVRIAPGATRVTPLDFEHYPISHSLAAVFLWAAGFALAHWAFRRDRRSAFVLGALVVSHWLLDAVVHRPDLPLYPGSGALVGFGLWSTLAGTLAVELALFGAGLWLYLRSTWAVDAAGKWALWGLVAILAAIYGANVLGPAPPGVEAIAWAGHAQWLLIAWGYWVDRHRRLRIGAGAQADQGFS